MATLVLLALLPWALVALGCVLGYRILALNGEILTRIDRMQQYMHEISPPAEMSAREGLPAGTAAPAFELSELRGGLVSLEEFRGRRVLLIFSGPHCIYCERLMPELAALPLDGRDGRPVPLIVSAGAREENLEFFDRFGVRCSVLLHEAVDLPTRYKAWSTPSGYLIDEEGTLISDVATGAEELLDLATNPKSALIKTSDHAAFLRMPRPPAS